MSLNVLKWVYNMGVTHERRRITAALETELARRQSKMEEAYHEMRRLAERPDPNKQELKRQEGLALKGAVQAEVRQLIGTLFEYGPPKPGPTIMNPDRKPE